MQDPPCHLHQPCELQGNYELQRPFVLQGDIAPFLPAPRQLIFFIYNMVLSVHSTTDDNLRAANCATVQVRNRIEAASVGLSITFRLSYGWSYTKNVVAYAPHLICSGVIYSIPSEVCRAVCTLSLTGAFIRPEAMKRPEMNAHLVELSSSSSLNWTYGAFAPQFEVIHRGSAFLRARLNMFSIWQTRYFHAWKSVNMTWTRTILAPPISSSLILVYYNGPTSSVYLQTNKLSANQNVILKSK